MESKNNTTSKTITLKKINKNTKSFSKRKIPTIFILIAMSLFIVLINGCASNAFDGIQDGESSNNADELVKAGNARLLAKDNKGALDAYNRAIAIDPKHGDALRGKSSALLNLASPNGSFAADFSKLIISKQSSASDISDTIDLTYVQWKSINTAIGTAKGLMQSITVAQLTNIDKVNISFLATTQVLTQILVTQKKMEQLAGTDVTGLSSDYSNIGDFIDFDNTDCTDEANAAADACQKEKMGGDDAVSLLDDAIASGNFSLSQDSSDDYTDSMANQLSEIRCELCFPDPTPTGYTQPSNCGTLAQHPECSSS